MPRSKSKNTAERRTFRRILASEVIPLGVARLATGQYVGLVNIALNGGVLIHSEVMLNPGSAVRLRLNVPEEYSLNLEGRIQRCRIIGLKQTKIQYEAGIVLDGGLPQPLAERLSQLIEEYPQVEQSTLQSDDPEGRTFSEAHLWILDSQEGAEGAQTPV
jgi:hypothetical protein